MRIITMACLLVLSLAGNLFGQTCPTTGSDIDCVTLTGTLTLISGPDPLKLAGFAFTMVIPLNGANQPFAQDSATYTNVALMLGTTSAPGIVLTCTATIHITTSSSSDAFNVQSCTGLPLGGTLTANANFAGNTIPDPIPLLINAAIGSGSTLTYTITGSSPTVLGINNGTISSICIGCKPETLNPSSIPVFSAMIGGPPQTSMPIGVGSGGAVLAYALTGSTTFGGHWLTVSRRGGQTSTATRRFTVTVTPGSLAPGTYIGAVKIYTLAPNSPQTLPVTLTISAYTFEAPYSVTSTR